MEISPCFFFLNKYDVPRNSPQSKTLCILDHSDKSVRNETHVGVDLKAVVSEEA